MSLAIDTAEVTSVLLQGETWVDIVPGSFDLDAYEMRTDGVPVLQGGMAEGVTSTGFEFRPRNEPSTMIYGPLTSVLAVACEVES